jgi:dienelactone hydrolase
LLKSPLRPLVRIVRARRILAAITVVAAWVWASCTGDKAPSVRCTGLTYQSMGHAVPARLCLPEGDAASVPAVVYLHAVDGPQEMPPGLFAELTKSGIAVFEIQYFAPTPAPGRKPESFLQVYLDGQDDVYVQAARVWPRVIADGVAFLREQPRIDGARVGAMGYSLGAAMSLVTAGSETNYRAAVMLSGFTTLDRFPRLSEFVSGAFAANTAVFPPALIIHGDNDTSAPVAQAYAVRDALLSAGRSPEVHIATGGDHFWKGRRGEDARGRIVEFFRRQLAT